MESAPLSSERLAKKRARLEELETEDAATALAAIKVDSPESRAFSVKATGINPFESLTPLLVSIYGEDMVSKWKASGKDVRKIWELSPPQVQCSHVIKEPKECWICGGEFDKGKIGLTPICDHVLPIAQSVFFLSLYAARRKRASQIDTDSKRIFELEYEWAHSICNNLKSSKIFVIPTKAKNGLIVNDLAVKSFLTDLSKVKSTQPGADEIRANLSSPMFINNRFQSMKSRLEEITNFLNEPISRGEGNLQLLAQTSSYVDPTNISPAFYKLLVGEGGKRKTFKRKNNGVSSKSKKHTYRTTSNSNRKRRTSNRGGA